MSLPGRGRVGVEVPEPHDRLSPWRPVVRAGHDSTGANVQADLAGVGPVDPTPMLAIHDRAGAGPARRGRTLQVVSFAVSADAYDRFMGRYSIPLASEFADFAGVAVGNRVLDVGCGPGALTAELVSRLGDQHVAAVDPSMTFVEAVRGRHPGVELHCAGAERLPLADDAFDAALAQLVVHFMNDPVGGLSEMGRVTKSGGVVAASVWDFDEGGSPLSLFWEAARDLNNDAPGEATLPGTRRGHLAELVREAGMGDVDEAVLSVTVEHHSFEDWWDPFELGVGPAGSYLSALGSPDRQRLKEHCYELLPTAPFVVTAVAWAARGTVPAR
jgi:SAM-dependent methyltransferase